MLDRGHYIGLSIHGYPMTIQTQRREANQAQTMGERIRILREQKDLTQDKLGELVGVSKSAVSQWECGETRNIKLETFLKLLEALEIDFAYLLFGPRRRAPPELANGEMDGRAS